MNRQIITEMGRQGFTLKQTAIGGDILLEIPQESPGKILDLKVFSSVIL